MKKLKNTIIGATLLYLLTSCTAVTSNPSDNEFTFVWIDNKFNNSKEQSEIELTRTKTIAEGLKQDKENGEVIFLGIGNIFVNNKYIPFDNDENVIDILNKAKFDYLVLSQNDIMYGDSKINLFNKIGKAKILTGNITDKNGDLDNLYDIKKSNGRRIGIFSLNITEKNIPNYLKSTDSNFSLEDVVTSAKSIIQQLKKEKVDFIVAIANIERNFDLKDFIKKVPEINLVINSEKIKSKKAVDLVDNTRIINFNSSEEGIGVLKINLDSNENQDYTLDYSIYTKTIVLKNTDLIFEDESLRKSFNELELKESGITESLATLNFDLKIPLKEKEYKQTNFSNLLFDAIKAKTDTDIICIEIGTLRNNLYKGAVTNKILEKSINNSQLELVTKEMTGAKLYELIEKGLSSLPKINSSTLLFSKIDFKINSNNPVGRKIIDLKINNQPIDLSKKYKVTLPAYSSNPDYEKPTGTTIKKEGKLINIIADYMRTNDLSKYKN